VKRLAPALSLLFLLSGLASGQRVSIKAAKEYAPYEKIVLKAADVSGKSAQFLWDVDGDADTVEDGGTLYVWARPGTYKVTLTAVDFETKKVERARFTFKVTGEGPKPPEPPGPGPGPTPPKPSKLLRVLVVYDPVAKYTTDQTLIMKGKAFRDYLKGRGPVDADNPIGPARIWPSDADVSEAPKPWADLFSAKKNNSCLIVQTEAGVTQYDLPADTKAAIALIEKASPKAAAKLRKTSNLDRGASAPFTGITTAPLSFRKAG
jgi:hypothetical protein